MKLRFHESRQRPPHFYVLQGYMVVPEGDSATAIERWFFVPWLSKFAEDGGVSVFYRYRVARLEYRKSA